MRRIRYAQHTPAGPTPMFEVVEPQLGVHHWHIRIRDAISGDEPEFLAKIPKKAPFPTPLEVAWALRKECNESVGLLFVTEVTDGVPTFSSAWRSTSVLHPPFCVWSTDQERCPMVRMEDVFREARRALRMRASTKGLPDTWVRIS